MKYVTISLLILSMLLTIAFITGSFVTYAPNITATQMQNIYVGSILRWGIAILLVQISATASFMVCKPEAKGASA